MQLRRMLLTLFLAGLCCVSLAACTPDNTPSEPESSGSGDTLTTTLLPGGWDAADFTVLLFDKYGPMDGASPVTLTDEEQKEPCLPMTPVSLCISRLRMGAPWVWAPSSTVISPC